MQGLIRRSLLSGVAGGMFTPDKTHYVGRSGWAANQGARFSTAPFANPPARPRLSDRSASAGIAGASTHPPACPRLCPPSLRTPATPALSAGRPGGTSPPSAPPKDSPRLSPRLYFPRLMVVKGVSGECPPKPLELYQLFFRPVFFYCFFRISFVYRIWEELTRESVSRPSVGGGMWRSPVNPPLLRFNQVKRIQWQS